MNEVNRQCNLGKKQSEQTKKKRSEKLIGISRPQDVIDKIKKNNPLKKKIICSNGEVYESIHEAAKVLGLQQANVSAICNGRRKSTNGLTFEILNKGE